MRFSTKRSVYSDMPSVLSQSAICCTATNAPRAAELSFRPSQYCSLHRIGAVRVLEIPITI
jgi:hypothetical protein